MLFFLLFIKTEQLFSKKVVFVIFSVVHNVSGAYKVSNKDQSNGVFLSCFIVTKGEVLEDKHDIGFLCLLEWNLCWAES